MNYLYFFKYNINYAKIKYYIFMNKVINELLEYYFLIIIFVVKIE